MFLARPTISAAQARRTRILAQIAVIVFALPATGIACAQAIDYSVQIDAPGALDDLLEDNLDLVRWRGNPRLDLEQLQRLVKDAPEQARTLIATEGYYSPKVSAGLDTSSAVPVARVIVDPGPPVLVGDVDLILRGFEPLSQGSKPFDPAKLYNSWTLSVGEQFRQADWEAAKRNLLRQVMQTRYPRAQLVETSATVDPDALRAMLRVVVDSGPEIRLGELRIEGLKRYPRHIVTNLNQIKPGAEYSEAALQSLQARLQDTGYFSTVEVSTDMAAALDENIDELKGDQQGAPAAAPTGPQTLPVVVRVTENKQRNVSVGVGYSTNTGARAQVNYDDLNVRGLRLKSQVIAETKRQAARADFYFPTTAKGYNDSFGAGFERNDLRGEITNVANVAVRRAWGTPLLERSLTFEYLAEKQTIEGRLSRNSRSLPLTYSWTKRELDNLIQPTRGYVLNAQIGGALLPVLTDERFVRAYTRFVNYRPISVDSTLILRGEAGALGSKQKEGVPSTFLFRAGGDQSVRGYAYQSLGVAEGDAVVGGRYLGVASAEYVHWLRPAWGAAVFYDVGTAADDLGEFKPVQGFGAGARWKSPVGPLNLDVAYGRETREVRLHFSVGFAF